MALLVKSFFQFYNTAMLDWPDPRSNDFPLMRSPVKIATLITVYFLFCLKFGPKFMKNRPAYDVKKYVIIFNISQILINGCLVILATPYLTEINWRCSPNNYKLPDNLFIWLGYTYFLTKIMDLLDTVFFILKKNGRQVTFLHLYHHAGMVALVWTGFKYYPHEYTICLPYINCIVHTLMYSYYLLCSISEVHKKNFWWKKYITQLQIVQFGLIFIIYFQLIFRDCRYPKFALILFAVQNLSLTLLFLDFYYKTYLQKKKQ